MDKTQHQQVSFHLVIFYQDICRTLRESKTSRIVGQFVCRVDDTMLNVLHVPLDFTMTKYQPEGRIGLLTTTSNFLPFSRSKYFWYMYKALEDSKIEIHDVFQKNENFPPLKK